VEASEKISTQVCIAGGGPAGMMLGLLLARAGVQVLVLEKHADFLRDFRGDTIHPSTLEVMHELGSIEGLLDLPHQKVTEISAVFGSETIAVADFRHLPTKSKFIAFMPQWDFLSFLAGQAAAYPNFSLRMSAEVTEPIERDGRICGVRATTAKGTLEIDAGLTVAADGRGSVVRAQSGLPIHDFGAPMDVLWFKLDRGADRSRQPLGRFGAGQILIQIDRGDYWQCGYVIAKGTLEKIQQAGFEEFRRRVASFVPALEKPLGDLRGWEDINLLTVQVNRLEQWSRPGLLCIGDAAHAMSPIGGIGINLAIQDAVAAANLLAKPLADGNLSEGHLAQVQRRREWPTKMTQRFQLFVQDRLISEVLYESAQMRPPLFLRLVNRWALLRRLPARLIGLGFRPEHVTQRLDP
jgi:2-polyprenyl-6-methoxyphenol hydroxylase-like FAD-dependent oxidoreductase